MKNTPNSALVAEVATNLIGCITVDVKDYVKGMIADSGIRVSYTVIQ